SRVSPPLTKPSAGYAALQPRSRCGWPPQRRPCRRPCVSGQLPGHTSTAPGGGDNVRMKSPTPADSAIGKPTEYLEDYDPALLFPIPRAGNRGTLDLAGVPLHGVDVWYAWELSWLAPGGLPQVAVAELRVPADSPKLIESKSLKLYLNGFMQRRAAGA